MVDSADVAAYQTEKLKKLAEKPNTTVFTVKHDQVTTAWSSERVRDAVETIAQKIQSEFSDTEKFSDFFVRKECMKDPQVLAFQRQHPKLYWMVTDREKMKEQKYRDVIGAMVELRKRVELGQVKEGEEADATATRVITDALK
ncbi:MAG: hypothetical protein CBC12_02830 [Candidatus Puniceispirillum sp. TMED52]|nr:MAG: hypothetical protein CBC12_02830 [Candidatus Puniceispirillum sp. TMED52]RPF82341.1 MAG: hypothetical protein CBC65_000550 [Rhodothermaceae bacterium TMED105]|tara:strand:- start:3527 stop:3955 length:429 start_codon:yes stop_codon:yes gene_type:complete